MSKAIYKFMDPSIARKAWRPARACLFTLEDQQTPLVRTICIHDVDPGRALPGGSERYQAGVRGPGWRLVIAGVSGQLNLVRSIRSNQTDINTAVFTHCRVRYVVAQG